MNALYRPGPMEYIPNFIARKHGDEEIEYDLPEMAEYLTDTYGITVYQEQVCYFHSLWQAFQREMQMYCVKLWVKDFALLEKLQTEIFEWL